MGRPATIRDVAAAAGVSIATASKALNARYGVAAETILRVREAAMRLGYRPGQAGGGRPFGTIAILVADFEPYSTEILKGVRAGLDGRPFELLVRSAVAQEGDDGWDIRSLNQFGRGRVDGVLTIAPPTLDIATSAPIVAIDPPSAPAQVPAVEVDSFQGALDAVNHLIELGHTRIGFIGGRPDLRSANARARGYRRALADAGIAFDPSLTASGDYHSDVSRRAAHEMLSRPDRPTAVFAANDLAAIAVLTVAHQLHISVPQQLSVVGFDDIPEATRVRHPLTTVRQPLRALGNAAANMLLEIIDTGAATEPHRMLPTMLIKRATTAPLPI